VDLFSGGTTQRTQVGRCLTCHLPIYSGEHHRCLPTVVQPARENNPDHENLRAQAQDWISGHPKECALLLKWARELAGKGRNFGIGLLAERLRWEAAMEGWEGDYKVNNNHRAYVARWLIQQEPWLENFMEFREVHW
jgi:hypothetical protein